MGFWTSVWGGIKKAAAAVGKVAKVVTGAVCRGVAAVGRGIANAAQRVADKIGTRMASAAPVQESNIEDVARIRKDVTEKIRRDIQAAFGPCRKDALDQYVQALNEMVRQYREVFPDLDFSRVDYEYSKVCDRAQEIQDDFLRQELITESNPDFWRILQMGTGAEKTAAARQFQNDAIKKFSEKLRNVFAELLPKKMDMIQETVASALRSQRKMAEAHMAEIQKLAAEKSGVLGEKSSVAGDAETTRMCCELALDILEGEG